MKAPSLFSPQKKIAFSFFLERIDFSSYEKTKGYNTVKKTDINCNYNSLFDDRKVFLNCVCDFIVENEFEGDIHLENAFYNLDELIYLNKHLMQKNTKVDTIFILSDKSRIHSRNKGIKEYKTHSRLVEISLDRILETYTIFEQKIQQIREYCSEQGIKIIEI